MDSVCTSVFGVLFLFLLHNNDRSLFNFDPVIQFFEADADLDLLVAVRTVKQCAEMPTDKPPLCQPLGRSAARLTDIGQLAFVDKRIVDVTDHIRLERQATVKIA